MYKDLYSISKELILTLNINQIPIDSFAVGLNWKVYLYECVCVPALCSLGVRESADFIDDVCIGMDRTLITHA